MKFNVSLLLVAMVTITGCSKKELPLETRVTTLETAVDKHGKTLLVHDNGLNQLLDKTAALETRLNQGSFSGSPNPLGLPRVGSPYDYGTGRQSPTGGGYYNNQPVIPAQVAYNPAQARDAFIPDTVNGQPVYVSIPVTRYGASGDSGPAPSAPVAPTPAIPAAPAVSSVAPPAPPAGSSVSSLTGQIKEFTELLQAIEGLKQSFGGSSGQQQYTSLQNEVAALRQETIRLNTEIQAARSDLSKVAVATDRYIQVLRDKGYSVDIREGIGVPAVTYKHTWTSYGLYDGVYYKYVFGWPGSGTVVYCYRYRL